MLTAEAERLFWRLTTVADDHGRFEAEPMVVMADCFKAMLNKVRITQVQAWLSELVTCGLVTAYVSGGKRYGEFTSWTKHQRVRSETSKYPSPSSADIGGQASSDAPVVGNRSRESRVGNREVSADAATEIIAWLNKKTGRTFEARTPAGRPTANLELVLARLKEGRAPWQLKAIISRKCREWSGDPAMAQYLRPATLFNRTKCEQYLGELPPMREEAGDGAAD